MSNLMNIKCFCESDPDCPCGGTGGRPVDPAKLFEAIRMAAARMSVSNAKAGADLIEYFNECDGPESSVFDNAIVYITGSNLFDFIDTLDAEGVK